MNAARTSSMIVLAALSCLLCRPAAADPAPVPAFVYETPGEFLSSGDFNGDGIPDVLVLDKLTGNARVGYSDVNGNLTWSAPLVTGVPNPTGCAVGRFQQTGWDTVAVTAPMLNVVNLVDLSQTNTAGTPAVVTPTGLGPHTVLPLANPLGSGTVPAYNYLLTASSNNAGSAELLDLTSLVAGVGTAAGEYNESGPFDRGNALQLSNTPATFAVGMVRGTNDTVVYETAADGSSLNVVVRGTNDSLDLWQFTNAPGVMLSFGNLLSGSDYTFGNFDGQTLPYFLIYQPGGTNLMVAQLVQVFGLYSFNTSPVISFTQAITGVFYLNMGTNGCAMIQFTNGVQGMTLPGGVPTFAPFYNSGAAAGDVFSGVVPLGNGNFALLDAPAGSPTSIHAQVVGFDGTNYTQKSSGNLPGTSARNTRANVWLFQSEPFVNRQPGLIASFSEPDWSDSISGLPGALAVKVETDDGPSVGLGSVATTNLPAPPNGSVYGLANQYCGAISLFSYGSPQAAQTVNVTIAPVPGIYDGPIQISFTTSNHTDQVFFRVGAADAWHLYATPFTLATNNTVQFYGNNAANAARSQLQSAAYSLGNDGLHAPGVNLNNDTTTPNLPVQTIPAPVLTLSPGGTIFYGRRSVLNNGTIWAINYDGSDDLYVTDGVRPRASRDGVWLAFMREGDPFNNQGNIWLRNLQTGVEQRLLVNTNQIVCYDWDAGDSSLIVAYDCGIYRLGLDGTLTFLFNTDCSAQAPTVNPVNGNIGYQDFGSRPGLYTANQVGFNLREIVSTVAGASWPAWSPDGRLLCFADDNSANSVDDGTNLWIVAPDGSNLNRICDFSGTDNRFPHGAIWSPDSDALVGAATLYETNGLWIVPLNGDRTDCDGVGATLLPTTPGDAIDFAGSIVVASCRPVITSQPAGFVATQGQSASVSVTAAGDALGYEWIKDGVLQTGQTNSTLNFASFQLTNSGIYQVVISNACGIAISIPVRVCLTNAPLRGWGEEVQSDLGTQFPPIYNLPVVPPVYFTNNVVTEAAGIEFSLFVTADGNLWSMGYTYNGAFDESLNYGIPINVATNVVAVAAGTWFSLYLTADGTLWAMGDNGYGQLGDGSKTPGADAGIVTYTVSPIPVASNVVAMAAGTYHSLYVTADGNLWAMGDNAYGQLGDGTLNQTVLVPELVAGNVVTVAAGFEHSLYVTADGNLWGMGGNPYGQLAGLAGAGNGVLLPEVLTNNVVAASAGVMHSLYVTADGTLWAMGDDTGGELGDGGINTDVTQPEPVAGNVVAASAGAYQSMYVTADGTLWSMGSYASDSGDYSGVPVQINYGDTMTASLSKGPEAYHYLAVAGSAPLVVGLLGSVFDGGLTSETVSLGQSFSFSPTFWVGDSPATLQWQLNGIDIPGATSDSYTVAGAGAGDAGLYTLLVTGPFNSSSGVGNVDVTVLLPTTAPFITQPPVGADVALGQPASVSVAALGAGVPVMAPLGYQWIKDGVLLPGQTGSSITFDSFQLTNCGAYQVAVTNALGFTNTVPVLLGFTNAPLRVWGYDDWGQLGDGGGYVTYSPEETASNVVAEAVGNQHSLYVTADGTLWAMGYDADGELGDGGVDLYVTHPEMVTNNVVAVAAGEYHSLYITADGTLWAMGNDDDGELGDGGNYHQNLPEPIATNVVAVAAGGYHSLYVTADGNLWAMGNNQYGQLGDGTYNATNQAEIVASNVVSVAAGEYHSMYLTADGTLWVMGDNSDGELGDGTLNNTNLPEMITNNVMAIAGGGYHSGYGVGGYHSLFVDTNGNLWAMGYNGDGELGDGTLNNTNLPELITNNVMAVAAGAAHSLFVTTDGNLWAMGDNTFGELGNGTGSSSALPVSVNADGMLTASLAKGEAAFHALVVAGIVPEAYVPYQSVDTGESFTFNVDVYGGDGPFTFQWQFFGTNLAGATDSTYSGTDATAADGYSYSVIVSGASGSTIVNADMNVVPFLSANPAYYSHPKGVPLTISISDLLTNAVDLDGYPIQLIGVGADGYDLFTYTGSTLATNSTSIFFTNSTPPDEFDFFLYTVTDSHGNQALGIVEITVQPQSDTTNTLTATPADFALPGTDVFLTNTVSPVAPAIGTPTGIVTFLTNGIAFVTDNLDGNGMTNTDVVLTLHGTNTVTVEYSGDANFNPSTNTINVVVDNPPVPDANYSAGTLVNQPLTLSTVKLLLLAADADEDPLSIISVTSPSAHGTVSLNNGNIIYVPAAQFVGADTITYSLFDTFKSVPGTISVTVNNNLGTLNIISSVVNNGGSVTLKYAGIPNNTYHVQVASNLMASPVQWQDLTDSTNAASASGTSSYTDTHTGDFSPRFYRTVSP